MDRDDVRMIQRSNGLRFSFEPLAAFGSLVALAGST
jgi:hypothetical protein